MSKSKKPADYTGMQLGGLSVIKVVRKTRTGSNVYLCKCKCGKKVELAHHYLTDGRRSCGCGYTKKQETLCWQCNNVVPKLRDGVYITGCEWSIHDKAVEGWDAVETEINQSNGKNKSSKSFCVKSCPKFTPYIRAYKDNKELKTNELDPIYRRYFKKRSSD